MVKNKDFTMYLENLGGLIPLAPTPGANYANNYSELWACRLKGKK